MKDVVIHLSKDLISRYGVRRFPVRKGDLVKIIKGDTDKDEKFNIVGKEGKVIKVLKDQNKVIIENINISKADGKMKPRKIDPTALIITKVVLEDKKRKERLSKLASMRNKVVEEPQPEPQSSGEAVPQPETTGNSEAVEEAKKDE
ncbi:MAG: 50S ribosomal protein L24 [Thermoplasmatales archaeon]